MELVNVTEEENYAKRSMIGAQFLLEIRARRSRRALSISLRYSASTIGDAMGGGLRSEETNKTKRIN